MKNQKRFFSIIPSDKKGESKYVTIAIGTVVLLILISALAPTALVGLFNTSAFNPSLVNSSLTNTGVPAWIPVALGALGAIAFVYLIWRSFSK